MKYFILLSVLLISFTSQARRGAPETEANYIVPTPPEFLPFSRFKVEIVDRFEGPQTQKISYVFPEFLVGEANRVITLTRIPNTENSWTAPEMNAFCTVFDGEFSCNIVLKKTALNEFNKNADQNLLNQARAVQNLGRLNLTEEQLKGFRGVIDSFYSHEPAGFLFYDID